MLHSGCLHRRFISFIALCALAGSLHAQFTGFFVTIDQVHYTAYPDAYLGSVNLDGYYTATVWAGFAETCDKLVGITSCEGIAANDACIAGTGSQLSLTFTGTVFQHNLGAITGDLINCAFFGAYPALAYDTWITVDLSCSSQVGDIYYLGYTCLYPNPWQSFNGDPLDSDYFDGLGFCIENGGWGALPFGNPGVAGSDYKVKMAQITTNGSFCLSGCATYSSCAQGNDILNIQCAVCQDHPCTGAQINSLSTVESDCHDTPHSIVVNTTANLPYTYNLLENGTTVGTFTSNNVDDVLQWPQGGQYTLALLDGVGCRDTSDVFSLPALPTPIVLNLSITDSSDCNGDDLTTIESTGTGGTAPLQLWLNGNTVLPANGTFELMCGDYSFQLLDSTGCAGSLQNLHIICLEALSLEAVATEATCFGVCDGQLMGQATNASQTINVQLNGGPVLSGAGSVAIDFSDLCAGYYQVQAWNEGGCQASLVLEVAEPPQVTTVVSSTDVVCLTDSNGSLQISTTGSPGVNAATIIPSSGLVQWSGSDITAMQLAAGSYQIAWTDLNGCTHQTTGTVGSLQQQALVLAMSQVPASCGAGGDGQAAVQVMQGDGPFSFLWMHDEYNHEPLADSLKAGHYNVLVTDVHGCSATSGITVFTAGGCIEIFNAITPNADGVNDTWLIPGIESYPRAEIVVYNRWGQVMFENRGIYKPWDGTFRGQALPLADYYYRIDLNDGTPVFTGTLTIKY